MASLTKKLADRIVQQSQQREFALREFVHALVSSELFQTKQ